MNITPFVFIKRKNCKVVLPLNIHVCSTFVIFNCTFTKWRQFLFKLTLSQFKLEPISGRIFWQFAIQSKVIYQRFFWIKILRKNKNYHHWFRTLFGNHILTVWSVIRSQKSRYRGRRIGVKMISIGLLWHSPPFSSFRWVLEEEQWWNRSYLLDFEGNLYVIRFSFGVAGFFYEN